MLGDDQVERYARQIVVPGIGAAGQEKLLASTVLVVGHPRGCRTAALYLRAAGVNVSSPLAAGSAREPDAVVLCDAAAIGEDERANLLARGAPVCWYAADDAGFVSGVHVEAEPLLALFPVTAGPCGPSATHDVAGCEAASLACAVLLRLPHAAGPVRFDC